MKKVLYFSFFALQLSVFTSCNDTPNAEKATASATVEVPKPPVYEFGFNLNDYTIVKDTIKQGDTFGKLLEENNIGAVDIHNITQKTKGEFNPKNIRTGKVYAFLYDKKDPSKPHSFIYQPNVTDYVVVRLGDSVHAYKAQRKVTIVEKALAGNINSNLTVDALAAGISANATYQMGQIFDYTIDFFRLQKGDNFKIIYEERYVDDTIFAGVERVKAAYFEWKG